MTPLCSEITLSAENHTGGTFSLVLGTEGKAPPFPPQEAAARLPPED